MVLTVTVVIKMGMMVLLATMKINTSNDDNNGSRAGEYGDDGTKHTCLQTLKLVIAPVSRI